MTDNARNFVTAAQTAARDEKLALHYEIDGSPITLYPPTPAALLLLVAIMADFDPDADELDPQLVSTVIQTFMGMLDEPSRRLVRRRLLDADDPFEMDAIATIVEWMVEDVGVRPTELPSASSSSRPATGRTSTANSQRATSTRSRSVRAVSST